MVAELIAGAVTLWELIGKDFLKSKTLQQLDKGVQQAWQRARWADAGRAYTAGMEREHRTIKPLGRDEPIPFDQIYTDVYIYDKRRLLQRHEIDAEQRGQWYDLTALEQRAGVERLSGLKLVQQERAHRLFLLGGPGAGKSTFLKYLTLQATRNQIRKVPILIALKRWADHRDTPLTLDGLLAYIAYELRLCNFPDGVAVQPFVKHLLASGKALVLFDALDEIPQADQQRDAAIAALRDFAQQYHQSQCIITCRRAATEYNFEQFTYVELADFNEEQIETFITNWFHDQPTAAEQMLAQIYAAEQRGVLELAQTPLLLGLLCLAFGQTLRLPSRRIELYHDAVNALLRQWDASRNIARDEVYKNLSPDRKEQLLMEIAARNFHQGAYFFGLAELKQQIEQHVHKIPDLPQSPPPDGAVIAQAIEAQHGILVTRAPQLYSFAHLSLQEYFTAQAIVKEASEAMFNKLFDRFLHDNRWREVLLLTASALTDPHASLFLRCFRQAVDARIGTDPDLCQIAAWVQEQATQAAQASEHYSQYQLRQWYWYVARDLALDLDLALALDLDLARELSAKLDQMMSLEDESARAAAMRALLPDVYHLHCALLAEVAQDPDYPLVRDASLAGYVFETLPDLARQLQDHPSPELHRAGAALLASLVQWSTGSCFTGVDTALAALTLPAPAAPDRAWAAWDTQLATIQQAYFAICITAEQLYKGQYERLAQYFNATALLVECLALAPATQRTAIHASLLLPPGQWQPPAPLPGLFDA